MDQDKRVAFITGAARGIGRTFAQALGEAGMGTVIADIDFETAEATAAELNAQGLNARAVKCNVADEASVDSAVKEMRSAFGRIDILINNAALHLMEWSCPVTEASSERWRQILDVNVIGIVNCARACRPYMKEAGRRGDSESSFGIGVYCCRCLWHHQVGGSRLDRGPCQGTRSGQHPRVWDSTRPNGFRSGTCRPSS
jgi:NAD(P)-dependent dehydrogenase (short-subunit alcohol dehydrogenase family)